MTRIAFLFGLLTLACGCRTVHYPTSQGPLMPETAETRIVFADGDWQDTGHWVDIGDQIRIVANGTWSPDGEEYCNANGVDYPGFKWSPMYFLVYMPNPLRSASVNMLIAQIGDGPPIPIGTGARIVSTNFGNLKLRANDWYRGNSDGSVSVQLDIIRASKKQLQDDVMLAPDPRRKKKRSVKDFLLPSPFEGR